MASEKFRVAVRKFDPFESALAKMWESFCRHTGCRRELEAVPMDLHPLYETLFTREGLRRGEWDLAQLVTDWIAEAREGEHIEDLTPFIQADPPEDFPRGWSDSLLGFQRFGEQIFALPFHDGPECLIYRTDLFADPQHQESFRRLYGRPLAPPSTWEEFHQVARFFTRPGEKLWGTIFAAYPDGHNTVFDFALQLWTRGGDFADAQGRLRLDTPEAAAAMRFYRRILADKEAVHPRCAECDSVQSGLAFARGEVAMMVNWFGFAAMCETIADSAVKGRVDLAPIPADPGCQSASLNCYWMYAVGSGCRDKDLAYRFARHCVSAANDRLLTLEGGIGCRRSTWEDAEVNAAIPYYNRLNALHENARTLPRRADWAQIAAVFDEVVLRVMQTEESVEKILAAGQARLEAL